MRTVKFNIQYIIRLVIFWLLYFAWFRMMFIVYHHTKIMDGMHSDTGKSFLYGIRLDLSVLTGAIIIPYILWTFQQFFKNRIIHLLNLGYNIVLIVFVSCLSVINLKVYGEWGTLLGARALHSFLSPAETPDFISLGSVLLMVFASGLFAYFGVKFYRRFITNFSYPIENKIMRWIQIVIVPVCIIIAFRGGLQEVPIDESNVNYSQYPVNNILATNNLYYFVHTCLDPSADADFYKIKSEAVSQRK